ncbi:hypothetical protein scyTo_0026545, partial [Scyliorhinus torazame]|nr:hypothetical protein [Scyliorhinus torazame]
MSLSSVSGKKAALIVTHALRLSPAAVIGQAKLQPPERMKHAIKLVDDQMNWCDSAME